MPTIFTVKQNLLHGLGLTRLLSPWNSWTVWFPLCFCRDSLCPISLLLIRIRPLFYRTLYNYIDQGYFTAINLDLPGRSCYKKRRHIRREPDNTGYRKDRSYQDFERYLEKFPDTNLKNFKTELGDRIFEKILSEKKNIDGGFLVTQNKTAWRPDFREDSQ